MKAIIKIVVLLGIINIGISQVDPNLKVQFDEKNNILIFQSEDDVKSIADHLKRQLSADPLSSQRASAEQIEDREADASSEQGTKNGQEVLADFEKKIGFRSLRAVLQERVDS